jgi:uncharacterized protein (DUF952 family)
METIYHITTRVEWLKGMRQGEYRSATLEDEGFMHCSTLAQVAGSANKHFYRRGGLALLHIDPERVAAEIRTENLAGGETLFPHIYGPLNLDAVISVEAFEPGSDGTFTYPL